MGLIGTLLEKPLETSFEKPLETTRLKFKKSPETGELISFVNRNPKTKKLKGVDEKFTHGKQICVLSKELKAQGIVREKTLYWAEMKPMNGGKKGYVVISATPILFDARIETTIVPKAIYKISVTFGNRSIYFDPKNGRTFYSRTLQGVLQVFEDHDDIKDKAQVIKDFLTQAAILLRRFEADGYIVKTQ